ncbi:MAG TPA: 2-methylcitrate dehydratase, partial [Rhodospirillum rubrum]|nr:2-methylcitrate dehydratase [Rhodospirillum rubrum]
ALGGKVIIPLKGGRQIVDELAVADAHPAGPRPFARPDYIGKFRTLAEGVIAPAEQDRFIALVERLPELTADEVAHLSFVVSPDTLGPATPPGIF